MVMEQSEFVVLDYGCKTCDILARYRETYSSAKHIGIDINEEYLDIARQRHAEKRLELIERDLQYGSGLEQGSVDIALIFSPNPAPVGVYGHPLFRAMFEDAMLMLKRGGEIYLRTECLSIWRYLSKELSSRAEVYVDGNPIVTHRRYRQERRLRKR